MAPPPGISEQSEFECFFEPGSQEISLCIKTMSQLTVLNARPDYTTGAPVNRRSKTSVIRPDSWFSIKLVVVFYDLKRTNPSLLRYMNEHLVYLAPYKEVSRKGEIFQNGGFVRINGTFPIILLESESIEYCCPEEVSHHT